MFRYVLFARCIVVQYELSLVGHDGVNESETSVIIRIKDVNDLPPAFLDQTYNSTIFEETIHTRQPILQVGQPPGRGSLLPSDVKTFSSNISVGLFYKYLH